MLDELESGPFTRARPKRGKTRVDLKPWMSLSPGSSNHSPMSNDKTTGGCNLANHCCPSKGRPRCFSNKIAQKLYNTRVTMWMLDYYSSAVLNLCSSERSIEPTIRSLRAITNCRWENWRDIVPNIQEVGNTSLELFLLGSARMGLFDAPR